MHLVPSAAEAPGLHNNSGGFWFSNLLKLKEPSSLIPVLQQFPAAGIWSCNCWSTSCCLSSLQTPPEPRRSPPPTFQLHALFSLPRVAIVLGFFFFCKFQADLDTSDCFITYNWTVIPNLFEIIVYSTFFHNVTAQWKHYKHLSICIFSNTFLNQYIDWYFHFAEKATKRNLTYCTWIM